MLLNPGPVAHSSSHQSSLADEADHGKCGERSPWPLFQSVFTGSPHRVYSWRPAASWGFWNFIERISSYFLAAPLNVSPFLCLTVVLWVHVPNTKPLLFSLFWCILISKISTQYKLTNQIQRCQLFKKGLLWYWYICLFLYCSSVLFVCLIVCWLVGWWGFSFFPKRAQKSHTVANYFMSWFFWSDLWTV